MPDWIVHVTVAWMLCRVLNLKFKEFNSANTILVMIGSLLPDLFKFVIFLPNYRDYLEILHIPFGTLIVAGIFSLFFENKKMAFLMLSVGVVTHYILDMLVFDVNGGLYLFYPLNWYQIKFGLIASDDWHFTVLVLFAALLIYIITKYIKNHNKKNIIE